ncbi:MAG: hypothetical protein RLZZ330_744 [Actinomycetota bacterium]|jgi:hypothetical protein
MTESNQEKPDQQKPWWVSSGPPSSDSPKFEIPKSESPKVENETNTTSEQKKDGDNFFGMSAGAQTAAINSGLSLLSAFLDVISKPLNGEEQTSTHDIETCGVCPLCVGVKALREHDENLADLAESAMKGVTSSGEKLKELFPNALDTLTESVVSAVIKSMMKR